MYPFRSKIVQKEGLQPYNIYKRSADALKILNSQFILIKILIWSENCVE